MIRIRLRIGETREQMAARVSGVVRRYESGELTGDCDANLSFQSWEHFAAELRTEAPPLADELLTLRDGDRFALFDTPPGQEVLARLWERTSVDTRCPG